MTEPPSVHASAVRVGRRAVLIRGPSGAGKSRLAFDLILAGRSGQLPPAVLVGDDRVHLATAGGQIVGPACAELAGLIEIRGLGIRHCDSQVRRWWVSSLISAPDDAERLPPPEALQICLLVLKYRESPLQRAFRPCRWLSPR